MVPAVLLDFEVQARSLVDLWFRRVAEGGVPNLHDAARYHLWSGGKRLRSALVLLVGCHLGASAAQMGAFAAAVELAHDASLVHDDIEDGDLHRRGRPSVWAKYGVSHAINLGDLLFFRAFHCLSQLPAAQLSAVLGYFSERLVRLAEGQALDLNLRADGAPTEEKYLQVARLKTVPLIELALSGTARLAGASPVIVSVLEKYSEALGVMFQIRDDMLDLCGGKGRPPGRDLASGVRSFPVCYALNHLPAQERTVLNALLASGSKHGEDEVARMLELVRCAEAVNGARAAAHRLSAEASVACQALPTELGLSLQAVLHGLVETL